MKKLLLLLGISSLLFIFSCGDDDPDPIPAAPGLDLSANAIVMDAGQTEQVTLNVSAEAGIAQFIVETTPATGVIDTQITGEPAVGADTANVTITITAVEVGNATISISLQDEKQEVDEVSIAVTVEAGLDYPFTDPYQFLSLRTDFSDTKFLIDRMGLEDSYADLADTTLDVTIGAETFFFFKDGWLDKFIENSPFIESRETMTFEQAKQLGNMFRLQQRDNDATDPVYRNNLVWESLTSATDENVDLGTTMNVRNRGIVGNGVIQTFARPFAFIGDAANAQIGTYPYSAEFDQSTATPTAVANAMAVNIKVQPIEVDGQSIHYGIIHAFDGFPADIDAAFADPAAYVESVMTRTQGGIGGRNFRDVSIIQNLMLVDPDVKWTMNAIDPNDVAYAGSAGLYGAVIVPATSYNDIDQIIRGIDASFAFGERRQRSGTRSEESVWFWDSGAVHVPDAVYEAAGNYWLKHWIPTEAIETAVLGDGDHTSASGETINLTGSQITLGSTTVNVLKRVRYKDLRVGRWTAIPEGNAPSQTYQDATDAQGFKWVEVIIVDGSL